jgi:N-acyl-D-amino-acid deacylase
MVDTLIQGARIIDGTGAPWFRGSVAVEGSEIVSVSRHIDESSRAEVTIDADGDVVAPGFIDTHSHSDLELFDDPSLSPKTKQGVTTEILGQDGFSVAPVTSENVEEWKQQLGPLAGQVEQEWDWKTVGEYLDSVAEHQIAPNIATLVGHGTVRFHVLGMKDRAPNKQEIETMATLVNQALEEGAIGFSTGLVYTPQSYATTDEVERLASELSDYGRPFVAHIRSERSQIWAALDEFIDIGAQQDIPLHLSHFKMGGPSQHGKADRAISIIESARERGIDFTVEQYPYTASSTTLTYVLPPWVYSEGPEKAIEYLNDKDARERIKKDVKEWRLEEWENPGAYSGWDNIVITQAAEQPSLEGTSIAEIADKWNTDPVLATCDILQENELQVSIINHFLDEEDVKEILSYERVNVASDGLFGGKPHPRVYGTFPRVLGYYSRDKNLLTIEEAVRKMTSLPARAMGLNQKGLLRPGMDADLVVFDPTVVSSPATFDSPKQYPTGISHVMVNGEFIVKDGMDTNNRPGNTIRK